MYKVFLKDVLLPVNPIEEITFSTKTLNETKENVNLVEVNLLSGRGLLDIKLSSLFPRYTESLGIDFSIKQPIDLTPYLMARAAKGNMRTRFVSGRGVTNTVIAHIVSAKGGVAQIHYQIHNTLTKLKIICDGIVILDGVPMVTFYENNQRTQNDIWIYYTSSLVVEHSGSTGALHVEIFVHEYV